jgi:hypothetical protein
MEQHGNGACFLGCTWRPRKDVVGGRVDTDGSARASHDSVGDLGNGNGSSGCGDDSAISRPALPPSLSSRSSGKPYPPPPAAASAAAASSSRPSRFSPPLGKLPLVAAPPLRSNAVSPPPVIENFRAGGEAAWPQASFDLSRTRSRPRWLALGRTAACPCRRLLYSSHTVLSSSEATAAAGPIRLPRPDRSSDLMYTSSQHCCERFIYAREKTGVVCSA